MKLDKRFTIIIYYSRVVMIRDFQSLYLQCCNLRPQHLLLLEPLFQSAPFRYTVSVHHPAGSDRFVILKKFILFLFCHTLAVANLPSPLLASQLFKTNLPRKRKFSFKSPIIATGNGAVIDPSITILFSIITLSERKLLGRGGSGLVVEILAFYSDDLSSNTVISPQNFAGK